MHTLLASSYFSSSLTSQYAQCIIFTYYYQLLGVVLVQYQLVGMDLLLEEIPPSGMRCTRIVNTTTTSVYVVCSSQLSKYQSSMHTLVHNILSRVVCIYDYSMHTSQSTSRSMHTISQYYQYPQQLRLVAHGHLFHGRRTEKVCIPWNHTTSSYVLCIASTSPCITTERASEGILICVKIHPVLLASQY